MSKRAAQSAASSANEAPTGETPSDAEIAGAASAEAAKQALVLAEAEEAEKARAIAEAAKRAETQAAADLAANASTPAGRPVERVYTFPMEVTLRNHVTLAFAEPVTGAFLPGGGSATVTLHDEDFAERVQQSLLNIVESNYLAPGALAVEPA